MGWSRWEDLTPRPPSLKNGKGVPQGRRYGLVAPHESKMESHLLPRSGIVRGQKVARVKAQRSKELRRNETPQERAVWQRVRRNRLLGLHFRRQQIIDGFVADFYCHAAGVVIELDGLDHLRQAD